jgi:hypothetical protein
MDVLPRLKLLNALTAVTPPAVTLVRSYTAKRNVSPLARSGFEPESPVHYRTLTCNAGNNIPYTGAWMGPRAVLDGCGKSRPSLRNSVSGLSRP